VLLDRDGVLIQDSGLVTRPEDLRVLAGVPEALMRLKAAGFALVVVSNQAVVARGLLGEAEVMALQRLLEQRLVEAGGPALDGFHFCPHHPRATLARYRVDCGCRKPRPGLLLQAAEKLGFDLGASYMVGDRPTDLLAGVRAGCRTVWIQSGQHLAAPIETSEPPEAAPLPDHVCASLTEAAAWILAGGAP